MNVPATQIVQGVAGSVDVKGDRGTITVAGVMYRLDPVIEAVQDLAADTLRSVAYLLDEGGHPVVRLHFTIHDTLIMGVSDREVNSRPRLSEPSDVIIPLPYITAIMLAGTCCGD